MHDASTVLNAMVPMLSLCGDAVPTAIQAYYSDAPQWSLSGSLTPRRRYLVRCWIQPLMPRQGLARDAPSSLQH